MTHIVDLDRALEAWFDAEALAPPSPDILESVTAITARRRPRPRLVARARQVDVPRPSVQIGPVPAVAVFWLILLTAAVSLIGAMGLLERERERDAQLRAVVPSAPPGVVPSASPLPEPGTVPPGLRFAWIGEPRVLPDYGIETRTKLNFDANAFWGTGTNYPPRVADSTVAFDGVTVVLRGAGGDCSAGEIGRYPWSLSAGGTVLTTQPGPDPCEIRSKLVPGTWFRTDCRNVADQCLGVLEPGTYRSQYVDPRVKNGDWIPNFGAVTFTVPPGWANSGDFPSTFVLTPATDYANESPDGPSPSAIHEIRLVTQPAAVVGDGSCAANDDPAVGRTVDALVEWLGEQPSLDAGAPVSITIDGNAGRMLDIRLRASWTSRCPGDIEPSAAFLTEAGFHLDSYTVGLVGRETARIILVDLGHDDVVAIVIDASMPDRFGSLVDAAMPIVDSLHFR
jgi:hypothetical protein